MTERQASIALVVSLASFFACASAGLALACFYHGGFFIAGLLLGLVALFFSGLLVERHYA